MAGIKSKGGTLRILALEYITGGGLLGQELPAGLAREGDAMLCALLRDLREIPGITAVSSRDPRLPPPSEGGEFIEPEGDIWAFWARLMGGADALWPIAPESGGILERMSRLAGAKTLIGSDPATVAITASKRRTANLLAAHGIHSVPTVPALEFLPPSDSGYVTKPDDGVGAEETRVFESGEKLAEFFAPRNDAVRFVAQPYLTGTPASISAVFRDGHARVLSCNRQDIPRANGAFRYLGFDVGALEELRPAFTQTTQRIARALPGLRGYAGIDLIADGGEAVVLEINPRLTTSYAGLSESLGVNAAQLILDFAAGREIREVSPKRCVRVTVASDG